MAADTPGIVQDRIRPWGIQSQTQPDTGTVSDVEYIVKQARLAATRAGDPDQDRRAAEALSLAPESLRAAGLAAAQSKMWGPDGFKNSEGEYTGFEWRPAAAAWRKPAVRLHCRRRLTIMIVDLDRQDGDQLVQAALRAGYIVEPSYMVQCHTSGHWQAGWILSIPVHTQPWGVKDAPVDPAVRAGPIGYFLSIQRGYTAVLQGCTGFDPRGVARNPGYEGPGQSTVWTAKRAYTLDELAAPLPAELPERPAGRKAGSRNPPLYKNYKKWCCRNPGATEDDRRVYLRAAADRRGESLSEDALASMARAQPTAGPVDPADSAKQSKLAKLGAVQTAERLAPRRAEVWLLHCEGWTQRAIAEHMDVSLGVVQNDLRALRRAETAGPGLTHGPVKQARGIDETGPTAGPGLTHGPVKQARGIDETGPTAGPGLTHGPRSTRGETNRNLHSESESHDDLDVDRPRILESVPEVGFGAENRPENVDSAGPEPPAKRPAKQRPPTDWAALYELTKNL